MTAARTGMEWGGRGDGKKKQANYKGREKFYGNSSVEAKCTSLSIIFHYGARRDRENLRERINSLTPEFYFYFCPE